MSFLGQAFLYLNLNYFYCILAKKKVICMLPDKLERRRSQFSDLVWNLHDGSQKAGLKRRTLFEPINIENKMAYK
jgi:hypothetical protein